MKILRAFLMALFPSLFEKEEKIIVRFVPKVDSKQIQYVLNSDAFKWFMDQCEREARYGEDNSIYKGVRFVGEKAEMIMKRLEPKPQTQQKGFNLGLDDKSLLEEERAKNG